MSDNHTLSAAYSHGVDSALKGLTFIQAIEAWENAPSFNDADELVDFNSISRDEYDVIAQSFFMTRDFSAQTA